LADSAIVAYVYDGWKGERLAPTLSLSKIPLVFERGRERELSDSLFRGISGRCADSLAINITQVAQKVLRGERFKMASMGIFC
jgi:hypothetical protein